MFNRSTTPPPGHSMHTLSVCLLCMDSSATGFWWVTDRCSLLHHSTTRKSPKTGKIQQGLHPHISPFHSSHSLRLPFHFSLLAVSDHISRQQNSLQTISIDLPRAVHPGPQPVCILLMMIPYTIPSARGPWSVSLLCFCLFSERASPFLILSLFDDDILSENTNAFSS